MQEHGTQRKAGWWVLDPGDEGPLGTLGPEPDDPEFAALFLEGDSNRQVHTLLRDQHFVSGVGRGYADDALNRAKLSPFSPLRNLTPAERAPRWWMRSARCWPRPSNVSAQEPERSPSRAWASGSSSTTAPANHVCTVPSPFRACDSSRTRSSTARGARPRARSWLTGDCPASCDEGSMAGAP